MSPVVALVPIVRAVLRDPDLVRLYITAYVSFFVITIAVVRGLKNVSPAALELMGSLNASRWTTMRYLRLRAALPYIFSGLRIAAPLSLIGAIREGQVGDVIEVLSSDAGSRTDIPAWIAKAGHALVEVVAEADFTRFVVRKAR